VQISEIRTRGHRQAFLKLPWKIYRGVPQWVPPLLAERRAFINRRKNPFFQHADAAYFLATENGEPMGRIAAVVNHRHNAFHQEKTGFFGLFECVNDLRVSRALFDHAADWLRSRGMKTMRGPANFSTNEEVGLLVEGFHDPAMILMPYNPPYYADVLEEYGLEKSRDLFAFVRNAANLPDRIGRIADRVRARGKFLIRKVDMKNLRAEIDRFKDVYNTAWEKNWGFVPMTEAEIDHMAHELKFILDPDLVFFVEVQGRMVGFSLTLPDFNQTLQKLNGRLFPFGLIRLLYYRRKIDRLRVLILGVTEGYRRMGVDVLLYAETFKEALRKGYKTGELSWILEDNVAMIRPLKAIGARHYKTYRIYDKPLV
jgi:GNAT superfamily N-acetyltransferase